jgi:hypothetical protein
MVRLRTAAVNAVRSNQGLRLLDAGIIDAEFCWTQPGHHAARVGQGARPCARTGRPDDAQRLSSTIRRSRSHANRISRDTSPIESSRSGPHNSATFVFTLGTSDASSEVATWVATWVCVDTSFQHEAWRRAFRLGCRHFAGVAEVLLINTQGICAIERCRSLYSMRASAEYPPRA